MTNFWQKLDRPFTVLAPMDGVTDVVFREVIADIGKPDVFFTEFVNADGLTHNPKIVGQKLKFTPKQRPIVAQIWGINPISIEKAVRIIEKLKFDGVDINMGCPQKTVVKNGGGAAMIKNPTLAKEIIAAAKGELPLSVKTRLGFDKVITNEWISFLLEQKLAAIIIHGRTAKQMSAGVANWEEIGKTVILRDKISPQTLIIGNGDIKTLNQVSEMQKKYGIDGVMIGRGIFANLAVFNSETILTKKQKIDLAIKHLELWDNRDFEAIKKYFKIYINNFRGAGALRQKLMKCKNVGDARFELATSAM